MTPDELNRIAIEVGLTRECGHRTFGPDGTGMHEVFRNDGSNAYDWKSCPGIVPDFDVVPCGHSKWPDDAHITKRGRCYTLPDYKYPDCPGFDLPANIASLMQRLVEAREARRCEDDDTFAINDLRSRLTQAEARAEAAERAMGGALREIHKNHDGWVEATTQLAQAEKVVEAAREIGEYGPPIDRRLDCAYCGSHQPNPGCTKDCEITRLRTALSTYDGRTP